MTDQTIEICHNHDIVCAPGRGNALMHRVGPAIRLAEGVTQHTNYKPQGITPTGGLVIR